MSTRPVDNVAEAQLLLRVDDTAWLLGIGTTVAYEMVTRHELPHVRLGRSVRVPRAALEAWIASKVDAHTLVRPPLKPLTAIVESIVAESATRVAQ